MLSSGLGRPPQNETKDEICAKVRSHGQLRVVDGLHERETHLVAGRASLLDEPHRRDVVDARVLRERERVRICLDDDALLGDAPARAR